MKRLVNIKNAAQPQPPMGVNPDLLPHVDPGFIYRYTRPAPRKNPTQT